MIFCDLIYDIYFDRSRKYDKIRVVGVFRQIMNAEIVHIAFLPKSL